MGTTATSGWQEFTSCRCGKAATAAHLFAELLAATTGLMSVLQAAQRVQRLCSAAAQTRAYRVCIADPRAVLNEPEAVLQGSGTALFIDVPDAFVDKLSVGAHNGGHSASHDAVRHDAARRDVRARSQESIHLGRQTTPRIAGCLVGRCVLAIREGYACVHPSHRQNCHGAARALRRESSSK